MSPPNDILEYEPNDTPWNEVDSRCGRNKRCPIEYYREAARILSAPRIQVFNSVHVLDKPNEAVWPFEGHKPGSNRTQGSNKEEPHEAVIQLSR